MFDWLRRLFRPVESGTLLRLVKHKLSPSAPTPEEFISPLKQEVTELLAVKPDIGYSDHCANCRGHQSLDTKLQTAVDTKDDPQPWLQQVHEDILENTAEQRLTQQVVKEEGRLYDPLRRWLIALTVSSGGIAGSLAAKIVWDVYIRDFILGQILPFLVHTLTLFL